MIGSNDRVEYKRIPSLLRGEIYLKALGRECGKASNPGELGLVLSDRLERKPQSIGGQHCGII